MPKKADIEITTFKSLNAFLTAHDNFMKESSHNWSLSEWARQLKLESTTSLTKILNGQRNVGGTIQQALEDYFNFSEKDRRYFQLLIQNEKIHSEDPLKNLIETEIALTAATEPIVRLSEDEWAQINQWYYVALRQLSRIVPLPNDDKLIKHLLNIQEDVDVISAMKTLVNLGLLLEVDNRFVAADVIITTTQNISSETIKVHHEQMGALALKAIRKYDVKLRNFQSCTFLLDQHNLKEAHGLIEKFIADLTTLIDNSKGNSVYQMNVQLFPLAVVDEANSSI